MFQCLFCESLVKNSVQDGDCSCGEVTCMKRVEVTICPEDDKDACEHDDHHYGHHKHVKEL